MVRGQRSRGWCFTVFGYDEEDELAFKRELELSDGLLQFGLYGRELCPDTGRRHLQGYVYTRRKVVRDRLSELLGGHFDGAHWEAAKGSPQANIKYCSKGGDSVTFGDCPNQGRRVDLLDIKSRIDGGSTSGDIAREHFGTWVVYRRSFEAYETLVSVPQLRPWLKVVVLYGPAGTGKTRCCWDLAKQAGKDLYIAQDSTLRWFDGYEQQQYALLDDYRGDGDFAFLLRLLDVYPLRVPIKGGFRQWVPTTIFITSNLEAEYWHPQGTWAALQRRLDLVLDFEQYGDEDYDTVLRLVGDATRNCPGRISEPPSPTGGDTAIVLD